MVLKKTRNRIKRLLKRRGKTRRRLRGGSAEEEKPIELSAEEKRTNKIVSEVVKGVTVDIMKELKTEGILDGHSKEVSSKEDPSKKGPAPRKDTFSSNRPTGLVEQILLAPVRIPAKIIKFPFKLYKAPIKFLKKFIF